MLYIIIGLLLLILVLICKFFAEQDEKHQVLYNKLTRLEKMFEQANNEAKTQVHEAVQEEHPTIRVETENSLPAEASSPRSQDSVTSVPEEINLQVKTLNVDVKEEPVLKEIAPENINENAEQIAETIQKPIVENKYLAYAHQKASKTKEAKTFNYEAFIGENLFGKIGILIFVIGIGFFVKYAIDNNWISEVMRTAMGFAIGGGMLALAYRLRNNYRSFSSLLAGGACAVFYTTVAIAFHYYELFSQPIAFIILLSVTILMISISLLYDRRELALVALLGGFLAPFIASSGSGNYVALLIYLVCLNFGMVVIAMFRKWSELPVCCFLFSNMILFFFKPPFDSVHMVYRFVFGIVLSIIMAVTSFRLLRTETQTMMRVPLTGVLCLHGFACLYNTYLSASFYDKAVGYMALFLALLHWLIWFFLRQKAEEKSLLGELLMGLTLIFATLALPMFFGGNLLLLFWSVEMILLFVLYTRTEYPIYAYATVVSVCLTTFGLYREIFSDATFGHTIFPNGQFATCLFASLSYVVLAYLMQRNRAVVGKLYSPWNALFYMLGLSLCYGCIVTKLYDFLPSTYHADGPMLFSVLYFLLIAYLLRHRFSMKHASGVWSTLLAILLLVNEGFSNLIYIDEDIIPIIMSWLTLLGLVASIAYIGYRYYTEVERPHRRFTIYLCILSTILWLSILNHFFYNIGLYHFSRVMSLGVSIAAFVQMYLGMRLHRKELRIFSILSFTFVLVKLAVFDVWQMPALVRIIVFILLGLLLLILSFLYQRLRNVLFKDDEVKE